MGSEPSSTMSISVEMSNNVQHEPLLQTKEEEAWNCAELKPRHTIFLSHSGAQKNFVEQLCEDLERAKQAPFFDKRPDSLPKGEKFAQLIFQAARQCQLAIVVVSEEYFSRSKWPMLELATFVEAHKCTILPLFLGLSCKEFSDLQRRQLWFARWDEWAHEDPRIRIDEWKDALRELDRRNGMEYNEAFGEVAYRKEVVATACTIVQRNLQLDEVLPQWLLLVLKSLGTMVSSICAVILFGYIFLGIIVPLLQKYVDPWAMDKLKSPLEEGIMKKPTCFSNGQPIKCPDFSHVRCYIGGKLGPCPGQSKQLRSFLLNP